MSNQAMDEFKLVLFTHLHSIPKGELITYGGLAKRSGQANYARQVGRILKLLPKDTELPWFRVVKSNFEIAFEKGSDAYNRQKEHLEAEGWLIKGQKIKRA